MHGQDRGFDVAALGGLQRRQRPVHGYDRLHICAGAGEIEDIEPAKAEADRSPPADIADGAPIGFPRQRVEGGDDAPAHSCHVGHERPQKLHRVFRPDRPVTFAEHVGDEDDITLAREHLTGFDGRLDDPPPIGRHQQKRTRRFDPLVPDQSTATTHAGYGVEDALDGHRRPPLWHATI